MYWVRRGLRLRAEARDGAAPGLPLAWRTFGGITLLVLAANVVGGVVVGLLLIALNADATVHQRIVVGAVGAVYGLAAILAGAVAGFLFQGRTLGWLVRGRTPTRDEARRVLRNPISLAVLCGSLWILGAVVMAVLALGIGATGKQVVGLSGGLVLAGLTTAGTTYSIASLVGRPITAIALSVYPPAEAIALSLRSRILLNWSLSSGIPLLGILLILATPGGHTHTVGAGIAAVCIALFVGLLTVSLLARRIGEPLRSMVGVLEQVGRGDLAAAVEVSDVGEIGMLQRGVNEMVAGLRERERIQDLFGRHVGPAVAEEAIASGVTLSGEVREVVALFVDITGSTPLTRRLEPIEFVAVLNRFFAIVVDAVEHYGGLVNKFEGDAALCIFGAPSPLEDPASAALAAARRIRDAVAEAAEVEVGIGVAAGPVVAGQIGTRTRLEYTVIGDAVNEAARLTELAKRVDGHILATDGTVDASADDEQVHWVRGRVFRLRGRDAPTHTYRAVVPGEKLRRSAVREIQARLDEAHAEHPASESDDHDGRASTAPAADAGPVGEDGAVVDQPAAAARPAG